MLTMGDKAFVLGTKPRRLIVFPKEQQRWLPRFTVKDIVPMIDQMAGTIELLRFQSQNSRRQDFIGTAARYSLHLMAANVGR